MRFVIIIVILFSFQALGSPVRYLQRSPRALLMGDAYTTLAEGNYSLFYNPALMGRNTGASVDLLNINLQLTNPLGEEDRFEDFPENDPVAITNRMMNFPVFLNAATAPGLKMGTFGMNFFLSGMTNAVLSNAVRPVLDLEYNYDRGFVFGGAYNFGVGRRKGTKRKKSGWQGFGNGWRGSIGMGAKYINREGIDESYYVFSTTLLNNVLNGSSSDIEELRKSLGYSKGKTWGFDAGVDFTYGMKHSQFSLGASVMNIGGLNFNETEGTADVPDDEANLSIGSAFRQDYGLFGWTLSADLRPLNQDIDFGRKFHLGFMLDLPVVDFMIGINEGYWSYGAQIDIYLFKLMAGVYSVELGSGYKELEGKRAIIYLSFLDFSFDA